MSKVFGYALVMGLVFLGGSAFAAGDAAATSGGHWVGIAAGLCMGIAAFGGAIAQSRGLAAALEGISRNPGAAKEMFTPLLLGLAFIEAIVLISFVIAFMLQGQI